MNRRERQIDALIAPAVQAAGCDVWGVEYLAQGKHSKLCIYIDRPDAAVSVDDCAAVSQQISELLDIEDVLTSAYTLEVSSPGLDRLLFRPEQYPALIGAVLDVRLRYPFEGRRKFVGLLVAVEDDEAVIRVDDAEFVLPIESIARARVVPQFADSKAVEPSGSEAASEIGTGKN